jgi:putative intracellular protease/amidase
MKDIVHLFVFNGMADWECGHAVAGINTPDYQLDPGRYAVEAVGLRSDPVVTAGGLTILPDTTLHHLLPRESAMLILPGGKAWHENRNVEAVETAWAFVRAGVPVAAICGATAGLAMGGLLDDRRHTSNAREYLGATGYRGSGLYRDAPAITDGGVTTAAGTSPVDFAYEIFKVLDLYPPDALEAWYGLFKTGDPSYYAGIVASAVA